MRTILLIPLLLISSTVFAQQIEKVEPPNWWSGMKHNNVQLMIYGSNLAGVKFRSVDERIVIQKVHTSDKPTYAFIDIEIPNDLPAGNYKFLYGNSSQSSFRFPILEREESAKRHQGFGPSDIVYLITPDRFANGDPANDTVEGIMDDFDPKNIAKRHGGDLRGIISRLDYLADLGITAIWLNPVLENNGINSYHGYKATNLYRIDPRFGSNEDYRTLVDKAHQRGIKVIFDHVSNHIGIRHPWIKNLPTKDWLNGTEGDHFRDKHYLMSISDPHADPTAKQMLKEFWFVDRMPDLNQQNPLLAKYLIQNSIWWIEYSGLDGIREDTYPYADQSFLANWAKAIRDEYPRFNIVGEIWGVKPAYVAQFQEKTILPRDFETHLPAVMDFPLNQALRNWVERKGKLRDVYEVIAQDYLYTDLNNLMVFVDNHDQARALYIANGNHNRVRVALAITFFTRGIPQILYGTEINLRGGARHVELRANFPGGFSDAKRNAFERAGRSLEENEMFDFVKELIQLRKEHPALSNGKLIHYPPTWNSDVYKFVKIDGDERILVVTNGQEKAMDVDLSELRHHFAGKRQLKNLLTGKVSPLTKTIRLPALGVGVYVGK